MTAILQLSHLDIYGPGRAGWDGALGMCMANGVSYMQARNSHISSYKYTSALSWTDVLVNFLF